MESKTPPINPLGFWLLLAAIVFFAARDSKKPQPAVPLVPVVPADPEPEPDRSFRVIFVKESGSTLTAAQTAIPNAKAIREYLNAKTTREADQPGWREYDPQQNTAGEQKTITALWDVVKPKLNAIPCMIVEVNGKATVVAYPVNTESALKTLQQYGGQ